MPPKATSNSIVGGKSDPIWNILKEKLPWKNTEDHRLRRVKQWGYMDVNGNGYLSLAEVDKGMVDEINLPQLFALKPVLMRAFQAAKNKVKSKSKHGKDYIEKNEYRWLLKYLRQYYEIFIAFNRIDKNHHIVSYEKFMQAKPLL